MKQKCIKEIDLSDQRTITFIATIFTIQHPITSSGVGNTLLGATGARPTIWILSQWEISITLALAEGILHITAVLTQRLVLRTTSQLQEYATAVVAVVTHERVIITTLVFASDRVFITAICTILDGVANLLTTQAHGSISTLVEAILLTADGRISPI